MTEIKFQFKYEGHEGTGSGDAETVKHYFRQLRTYGANIEYTNIIDESGRVLGPLELNNHVTYH